MKIVAGQKTWLWIIVGSFFNAVLATLDRALGLPVFLDSIFTAVAAAVLGPGPGVLTAVLSQFLMQLILTVTEQQVFGLTLPFVLCQLVTALVVGFMAKTGTLKTPLQVLIAVTVVALGNSVVGSLVATFVFGGINLHSVDYLVAGLVMGGQSLLEASFWSRVPINLFDKGLAVVAAYLALEYWKQPAQETHSAP